MPTCFADSLASKKPYNLIRTLLMAKEADLFGLTTWFVQEMKNISTNALMTNGENTTALINETLACGAPMVPILFGWREVHTTMAVLKF